ncbi:Protein sel-1 1 [Globodera pallida]|nr:Protein sel-1 1 [Globodera pallida]
MSARAILKILVILFLIAYELPTTNSTGEGGRNSNEDESDDDDPLVKRNREDDVVLLSADGETDVERQSPAVELSGEFTNEKEEKVQNADNSEEVEGFEELIPEKRKWEYDAKAVALFNGAMNILSKRRWSDTIQRDIRTAYMDLEESAQLGHLDAMKILGFSYLFGDYRWSIDEAKTIFEKLAELGSPNAHLGLGFLYSSGAGVDEPNPALGFLHYTFAALGGNPLAQMALGYRFANGVGTKQNCETGVKLTGTPSIQRIRIPDELESSSITGTLLDNNVFSYYKYLAETGDMQAILGLAQLYLTGGKGVAMDLNSAAKYFTIASEAGSSQANGFLGKMYLEGTPATPQHNITAFQFFKKAADKGNAIGQAGLGMMFLYGYGVKQETQKALKLFALAAEQGSADAQLHLGQMYYQGLGVKRDFKQALKYFQLASQSGHILAIYNLAQMHAKGTGVLRNCRVAVALYKNVAERGRWGGRFMDAYLRFQNGGAVDEAAFRYLFLAEFGYEAAQTNFAFLVDREDTQLFGSEEAYRRAFMNWLRAANQDYPVARVKLGDYKYYGLGSEPSMEEAAEHYKLAATSHQSAQAMFNLGYMHQHGLGVQKDLHLAKRYYDLAAETSTEAVWPVSMALMKLRAEFLLEYLLINFSNRTPSLDLLDTVLGPDWDLYLMSLILGLIVWLAYCYFRNRQNGGRDGGEQH